jgi:hypothetical protein
VKPVMFSKLDRRTPTRKVRCHGILVCRVGVKSDLPGRGASRGREHPTRTHQKPVPFHNGCKPVTKTLSDVYYSYVLNSSEPWSLGREQQGGRWQTKKWNICDESTTLSFVWVSTDMV